MLVVTVNNGGLVIDRKGQVVRCSHPVDEHCSSIAEVISSQLASLGNTKQARADFAKRWDSGRVTGKPEVMRF